MRNWLWTLILLIIPGARGFASGPLQDARDAFPVIKSEKIARSLIEDLESSSQTVALAYRGAITTMLAEFVNSPWTKYKYFQDGKSMLEKAVKKNPGNPEIRYIRLLIQSNCPGFLDYSSNISEDARLFANEISSYALKSETKRAMIGYVLSLQGLDSDVQEQLITTKASI